MLEHMQPYNSEDPDANYLGWLNKLARIDRHRRLAVVTAYLAEMTPAIGMPKGCTATLQFGDRVLIDGEANIARIQVTPWQDGWKVEANPRVGIDPEIADWAESPFWQRIPYNERFTMIQVFVMGRSRPTNLTAPEKGASPTSLATASRSRAMLGEILDR